MSEWILHVGNECPVDRDLMVEVRLAGDAGAECEPARASEWAWGPGEGPDGEGRILAYRVLRPAGIGDVTSTARDSGARFNTGKPAMELIPLDLIAAVEAYGALNGLRGPLTDVKRSAATFALSLLGDFQMRSGGHDDALLHAAAVLDSDRYAWQDCARVFDYGRAKYAAWNWSKGMPWSVPIGCAARHLLAMLAHGPLALDAESRLPHRGHVMCNLVMLLWFETHYPEGDDRAPVVSLRGNDE